MNKKFTSANISVLLGNLLEFYDFTLFAALLPIIAPLFFPNKNILASFNISYIVLAIGFFSRPLGAIIFGYVGDIYSRKRALILSILLMSCATVSIGLLPSYNTNNKIYIMLLVLCRILQGLSAGGEYSGAGLLLTENNPKQTKNYASGSLLTAFGLLGAFVASIMAAIVSIDYFSFLNWRALFLMGGCLGFLVLSIRLFPNSLPTSINMVHGKQEAVSWAQLLRQHKVSLLCTVGIGGLMNVPFYLITGFINTYFSALNIYNKSTIMFINAAVILLCAILTIVIGGLSKYFGHAKMMLLASVGMFLFAVPFFLLIGSGDLLFFIIGESVLIFLSQMFVAPAIEIMAGLFPYGVRYRGMALGNCLGLAFLGGSTPYISGYLVKQTGLLCAPAIYLSIIAILGFFSVLIANNKLRQGT